MAAVAGLYRRILPPPAIDFACREGKEIFRESLEDGTMEGFFKLVAHFQTQAEPAFCGLASLSMVLNSLSIDPGRTWKGPWRWFDESMLDCCEPLEKVKIDGISFAKVACLGECSGAGVDAIRANESSLDDFRRVLKECCSSEDKHMIASYNRKLLKQTGSGHFSPIGGFHERKDLALILDVARFKYPPHWVPLSVLWDAVNTVDPSTGKLRGYLVVTKRQDPPSQLFTSSCKVENWREISNFLCKGLRTVVRDSKVTSVLAGLSTILESFPGAVTGFVKWIVEVRTSNGCPKLDSEEMQRLSIKTTVLNQLRSTDMYKLLAEWLKSTKLCSCALSEKSLTDEVGEASCQGKRLLFGGVYKSESCVTCKRMTATNDGQSAGVVLGDGGASDSNVQVIVPTAQRDVAGDPRLGREIGVSQARRHRRASGFAGRGTFLQLKFSFFSQSSYFSPLFIFLFFFFDISVFLLFVIQVRHLRRQLRVLSCCDE